jgi:hypothetical protein
MSEIIMHHMGTGLLSPCGLEPASVYSGFQGGFTTDWAEVDCQRCLARRTPKDQSFYVTFGGMYRHEEHPYWKGAHPDGWLELLAPDEEAARLLVRTLIGLKWAHMYDTVHFHEDDAVKRWYPKGRLALVTSDGRIFQSEGVEPPTPRFGASSPEYYGHDSTEVVAARIEGELAENSNTDAVMELGYEAEIVHRSCFAGAVAMFRDVTDVDYRVLAGELDWSVPYECIVCQESIT